MFLVNTIQILVNGKFDTAKSKFSVTMPDIFNVLSKCLLQNKFTNKLQCFNSYLTYFHNLLNAFL